MTNEEFVKKLYKMRPLERICFDSLSGWTRVPGGWVYGDLQGTTFVPFDNEFQEE